jgi:phosphonate transport system ATP-binding protein
LVDEPLSALDPKRSRQAIQMLIAEAKKRDVTLIVTLHQVDVATKEFSRVIGLQAGELAFDLPSADITKNILQDLYAQNEHEITQLETKLFHAE